MKYALEKRKAESDLEYLIKERPQGIEYPLIVYTLTKRYLVSELAIKKRLNLLEGLGIIKYQDGVFKWTT